MSCRNHAWYHSSCPACAAGAAARDTAAIRDSVERQERQAQKDRQREDRARAREAIKQREQQRVADREARREQAEQRQAEQAAQAAQVSEADHRRFLGWLGTYEGSCYAEWRDTALNYVGALRNADTQVSAALMDAWTAAQDRDNVREVLMSRRKPGAFAQVVSWVLIAGAAFMAFAVLTSALVKDWCGVVFFGIVAVALGWGARGVRSGSRNASSWRAVQEEIRSTLGYPRAVTVPEENAHLLDDYPWSAPPVSQATREVLAVVDNEETTRPDLHALPHLYMPVLLIDPENVAFTHPGSAQVLNDYEDFARRADSTYDERKARYFPWLPGVNLG